LLDPGWLAYWLAAGQAGWRLMFGNLWQPVAAFGAEVQPIW